MTSEKITRGKEKIRLQNSQNLPQIDYKSKPPPLYFGDTENTNFIIAIMAIVCLLNRKN